MMWLFAVIIGLVVLPVLYLRQCQRWEQGQTTGNRYFSLPLKAHQPNLFSETAPGKFFHSGASERRLDVENARARQILDYCDQRLSGREYQSIHPYAELQRS